MKQTTLILLCTLLVSFVYSQRDLTPGKRRGDTFGKADYKDYRFFGLQVSGGPTYMMTRSQNPTYSLLDQDGRKLDYTNDPSGKLGAYIEVGLAHFPKKRSKFSERMKFIFISYYDWGLGFKLLGGKEVTTYDHYNSVGQFAFDDKGEGEFYNGYAFGRFSIHKNVYLGEKKRYFIDNGLGFNFDFRVMDGNKGYEGTVLPETQYFHNPFVAQFHYDLGLGVKLSRRSFLIIGAQAPVLGLYEWRKGCSALKWYNSNYVPLLGHIKFIYLFEKKSKGCKSNGTDEDRKRNEEFLQNN